MTADLLDGAIKAAQKCVAAVPVVVLGSGASADVGIPGMGPLKAHLAVAVAVAGMTAADETAWKAFLTTLAGTDLESALQSSNLSQDVNRRIIDATWAFIRDADQKIFDRMLAGSVTFPLTRLLSHLFRSTHGDIGIVTTNYDLLAEYAAEAGHLHHYTGFGFGRLRRWQVQAMSVQQDKRPARTVRVFKVHGSLDWFAGSDSLPIALYGTAVIPPGIAPLIVTPGLEKYRRTHSEPFRDILRDADTALATARGYLCVGYGFNDEHIQPKLIARCERDEILVVVLAMELTKPTRDFLFSGRCRRFVAFEKAATGTRIYSPQAPAGFEHAGADLWRLEPFLNAVL